MCSVDVYVGECHIVVQDTDLPLPQRIGIIECHNGVAVDVGECEIIVCPDGAKSMPAEAPSFDSSHSVHMSHFV